LSTTIIEELLEEMERNVQHLESLRPLTLEEFAGDPRNYLFAERCFQLAIQCLVDIAYYLASQKGWQKPESASEAIIRLGQQRVLEPKFAEKVVGMANFRNILVHAYLQINRAMVHELLAELEDFREFTRQITGYLDGEPDRSGQ
jgi:uncharacterized protein YutE (UPF0331/DUF86 family)